MDNNKLYIASLVTKTAHAPGIDERHPVRMLAHYIDTDREELLKIAEQKRRWYIAQGRHDVFLILGEYVEMEVPPEPRPMRLVPLNL